MIIACDHVDDDIPALDLAHDDILEGGLDNATISRDEGDTTNPWQQPATKNVTNPRSFIEINRDMMQRLLYFFLVGL